MRNCATSCWPCTRKSSTRLKRFWRQDNDEPHPVHFLEKTAASRSGCGTALRAACARRKTRACGKSRSGANLEGFSKDGDARRRPIRERRAQVRRGQAPRRRGPRSQDFRHNTRAGQFARGSRILRAKNPDRGAAVERRSAHQDHLSRRREEMVSPEQEFLLVRELRHWHAVRRPADPCATVSGALMPLASTPQRTLKTATAR